MGLGVTLSTIEEIPLDVVADGEQGAAGSVGDGVDTIGTKRTLGQGSLGTLVSAQ